MPETEEPPETEPIVAPRRYAHVLKAVYERPWAMQPAMLTMIGNLLSLRAAGGVLSEDDITERLAAAAAANGSRQGGGTAGGVAVIPMYGMLSQRQSLMGDTSGGTSLDALRADLRSALADPGVSAIVFDIDSPGGSVDGVPEFAAELRKARGGSKPIVAQVDTMAASAAYWLAAQMTEVVVTPSGSVGSVGVFAMHEDVSRAADAAGVTTTFISAGKYKVDGNQFEPLSDTARAALQDQVDAFYGMFVGDLATGRGMTAGKVEADFGQGRELLAKQALDAGMVDRIDTLDATVNRLAAAAKARAPKRTSSVQMSPARAASGQVNPKLDRAWAQRMKGRIR